MRQFIYFGLALFFIRSLWIALVPIHRAPGVLVPDDPTQINFTSRQPAIKHGNYSLEPLAQFSIKGRVISTSVLGMDATTDLAKYDVALGWGCMSDSSVLDQIDFFQVARFVQWTYPASGPPRPDEEICTHIAHIHVIANDSDVAGVIKELRRGSLAYFTGYLVEATGPKITPWRSSMTRTDKGNGACEIMLVKSAMELD